MDRKALIVDDDSCVRISLSALLETDGWETVEGRDGEDAMNLAVSESPDLVLLDVLMPGKDGFEVYQEIREDHRTAHIPVVMVTSMNDQCLGEVHDSESVGTRLGLPAPEGFLDKPFNWQEVLEAARHAVGQ